MEFSTNYTVGGILDRVRRIDSPVQIVLPSYLFATYEHPLIKGFRLEVPASPGMYPVRYVAEQDMELLSLEVGCTGYSDVDYWSFYINERIVCENIYCKEVAQTKNLGAIKLTTGDELYFEFNNNSGTSKVVWLDLNFAVKV